MPIINVPLLQTKIYYVCAICSKIGMHACQIIKGSFNNSKFDWVYEKIKNMNRECT